MENKARKMFAAVVVIMLCAVAIVGVGYAYNASTQNSGNTAVSNYVVLSQENYTWGDKDLYYDTATSRSVDNILFKYSLLETNVTGTYAPEITGLTTYSGALIGAADKIKATHQGDNVAEGPYKITITQDGFTNISSQEYWTYILMFEKGTGVASDADHYQYVLFNGATVTYHGYSGGSEQTNGVYLVDNVDYTVSLYYGGLGVDHDNNPSTEKIATVTNSVEKAASGITVDSKKPNVNITAGTVTFAWASA